MEWISCKEDLDIKLITMKVLIPNGALFEKGTTKSTTFCAYHK